MSAKLVILDRDGVINQDSDNYVKSLDEWIPYPSSIKAIARLSQAGWTVAVATNQSGIARGYYDEGELARMHEAMVAMIEEAGARLPASPTARMARKMAATAASHCQECSTRFARCWTLPLWKGAGWSATA